MSKCPWCGKGEQAVDPFGCVWWVCRSRCYPDKEPIQSTECEAYCDGRDEGRRRGHLEAASLAAEEVAEYWTESQTAEFKRSLQRQLAKRRRG